MKTFFAGLLALGISQTAIADDDCTNLMNAVTELRGALDEALMEKASSIAKKTEKDLSCQQTPVPPLVLTSVFHLAGAVHLFNDQKDAAWEAFAFSASISPMASLNPVLGKKALDLHTKLRESVLANPQGQLQFSGEAEVWVDGKPVQVGPPIEMPAGKHFIQWRSADQIMQNRVIRVESGEARAIPVGPGAESFKGEGFGENKLEAKQLAYIGGAVAVVGGGVMLALGIKARSEFDQTSDPDELDALAQRANLLLIAGGATSAIGVGTLIAAPIFLQDGGVGLQVGFIW